MPTNGGKKNSNTFRLFTQDISFFDAKNDTNRTALMPLQGSPSSPQVSGLGTASGLLLPDKPVQHRTDHFPEDLYDLRPTSHLMRFLSVLLGDAGTGQLRKRYGVAQMQQILAGSHFYDLDGFYGSIFNAGRAAAEDISVAQFNPLTDTATQDEWDAIEASDASYRERIIALAQAISLGATRPGLLAAAEAVLGDHCDIYEGFELLDPLGDHTVYLVNDPNGDGDVLIDASGGVLPRTWHQLGVDFGSYLAMEADTWIGLEFSGSASTGGGGTTILFRHWSDLDTHFTYTQLDTRTWAQLETLDDSGTTTNPITVVSSGQDGFISQNGNFAYMTRYSILIRPKRAYHLLYDDPVARASAQAEDEEAIRNVIEVLRPAGVQVIVDTQGVEINTEIAPGNVAADSEYWDVVAEVVPRQSLTSHIDDVYPLSKMQAQKVSPYTGQLVAPHDPHPLPMPAFAGKQGEQWSYASEVVSTASYTEDENGNMVDADTYELVTYADGQTVSYRADQGILDATQALAGRYAASGITVAAPYSDVRPQVGASV